jgi:hypothetical protein
MRLDARPTDLDSSSLKTVLVFVATQIPNAPEYSTPPQRLQLNFNNLDGKHPHPLNAVSKRKCRCWPLSEQGWREQGWREQGGREQHIIAACGQTCARARGLTCSLTNGLDRRWRTNSTNENFYLRQKWLESLFLVFLPSPKTRQRPTSTATLRWWTLYQHMN